MDVIHETGSGRCARSKDIAAIADIFLDYYLKWQAGSLTLDQDRASVKKYERREVAKQLAELLDEVSALSL